MTGAADAVSVPVAQGRIRLDVLTHRKREMLGRVAHGLSDEDIATRLFLSP